MVSLIKRVQWNRCKYYQNKKKRKIERKLKLKNKKKKNIVTVQKEHTKIEEKQSLWNIHIVLEILL